MLRKLRKIAIWVCVLFVLLSVIIVLPWRWINPPTSAFILKDWWQSKYQPAQQWVDYSNISSQLVIAVIASEDQLFPVHYGFDLQMIADAMEESPDKRRGASTITQQVAKNLFLWGGRSYMRKAIEAWLTLLIETLWSKQRILEVYLNIAEFGRGVYGVDIASREFFNKTPDRLNAYEAALLAAVLPNPKWRKANRPSEYVKKRAAEIMRIATELDGLDYLKQIQHE